MIFLVVIPPIFCLDAGDGHAPPVTVQGGESGGAAVLGLRRICLKLGGNSGKRSSLIRLVSCWVWMGKMYYLIIKENGKAR